jgi:hypothetical protein
MNADELQIAIQSRIDRLERTLGRPGANKQLPMSVRIDEVMGWLHLDDEVAALRAARLVAVPDLAVQQLLRDIATILR